MNDKQPKKPFSFNDMMNRLTAKLTAGKAKEDGSSSPKKGLAQTLRLQTFLPIVSASLVCIAIGIAIGFLLMLTNPQYFGIGFVSFWETGFSNLDKVVYLAGPLLLCSLSVGVCYKCGLFNIGASGQFTLGGAIAVICALHFHLSWWWGCLFAMGAGALVGSIPGLLKAFFNINEVITAIMLNWIVLFVCDVLIMNVSGVPDITTSSKAFLVSAAIQYNPNVVLPFFSAKKYLNLTIILGIASAISLAIVLYKTTFGYKLRSVGFNRDAAKYAGISDKRNIVIAFIIAGALAGLGGACYYLLGTVQFSMSKDTIASQGFDAIPISLLANNNPIGIIFSTFFIAFIKVAGNGLQGIGTYNDRFVDIIISVILYLSGFATLFVNLFLEIRSKKKNKTIAPPIASSAAKGDK